MTNVFDNSEVEEDEIPFTVASALLRELGERLVGRPHIALAELVKNAFDADARHVDIDFQPDTITVTDDGHGMTHQEFVNFWMHIGTPHKQEERLSRNLQRPLTGSKGVGRLAVQFLARKVEIQTLAAGGRTLVARVDWQKAVEKEFLTEVTAQWYWKNIHPELPGSPAHGTRIILSGLNQKWEDDAFRDLAREIWMLQPPFPASDETEETRDALRVNLTSFRPAAKTRFDEQMKAVEANWIARIIGSAIPSDDPESQLTGRVTVQFTRRPLTSILQFDDRSDAEANYYVQRTENIESTEIPGFGDKTRKHVEKAKSSDLGNVRYDIRVYNLSNRQPDGITVNELKDYLKKFGGVHIYDSGFRLPFYGGDTDWLNIERDHSHRKDRSILLPEELQARNGLNDLPTNERIFGLVYVNTGKERIRAYDQIIDNAENMELGTKDVASDNSVDEWDFGSDEMISDNNAAMWDFSDDDSVLEINFENKISPEYLTLQVTRDRLVDNRAFAALRDLVRFGLDFYATEVARRKYAKAVKIAPTVTPSIDDIRQLNQAFASFRSEIPEEIREEIDERITQIIKTRESENALETQRTGLLGALATAGITAIAYEHEVSKQLHRVEGIIERLRSLHTGDDVINMEIMSLGDELTDYLARTRATRALFTNVMNEENRDQRMRFRAQAVIESTGQQMGVLLRKTQLENLVEDNLRLPEGSYAEWSALFQNVLINAVNAMLDSPIKCISALSRTRGRFREIIIRDTGSGVDLSDAEKLFEPFQRRQNVSPEHAELGYGGTGLGLTIVQMIARNLGCKISFEAPDPGFSTSFRISWEES